MENSTILKIVKTGWFFFATVFLIVYILGIAVENNSVFATGPWKGRIIDIETKEPIEGVVVLAAWQRAYRTPAGDNTYFYNAKEVLTDKEGRFEIPSYRPINLLPIISYIREPEFTIFKPGYLSLSSVGFGGFFLERTKEEPLERKDIRGKTFRLAPGIIELPKLKTREERLEAQSDAIPLGEVPDDKMPALLNLINAERKNLGVDPTHVRRSKKEW